MNSRRYYNEKMPVISVIIPTYNRPDLLRRALGSVLKQTWTNYEVIVVDDHSVINMKNIVNEFEGVRYVRNAKNMGGAVTRNIGLSKAKGSYIAFLDDDDEMHENKLKMQIEKFQDSGDPFIGVVYCDYVRVDRRGKTIGYGRTGPRGDVLVDHLKQNIAPTSATLVKKEAIASIGGFRNLRCSQEYDLWLRIIEKGYHFDYCDQVLLTMHIHGGPRISNDKNRIDGLKEMYKIRKKYFFKLKPDDIKDIKFNYHYALFREYIALKDRRKARHEYFCALNTKVLSFRNLVEFPALFFNYTFVVRIKAILHSLRFGK